MANDWNAEVSTIRDPPRAEPHHTAPQFPAPYQCRTACFHPGELLLGRFRIVRQIGPGGMGEVYLAEDLELGTIALKTIREEYTGSRELFDSFRQEVQVARRVTGTQVCRIHELFLLPAQGREPATAFLTMEYIDGVTLFEKLRSGGPLPLKHTRYGKLERANLRYRMKAPPSDKAERIYQMRVSGIPGLDGDYRCVDGLCDIKIEHH